MGAVESTLTAIASSLEGGDFRDLQPRQLDKFIAEELQPNEEFKTLVYTALNTLCRHLQSYMRPPSLKRLVKGGSMGKGTALKNKSDLDCILIMNGIANACELKEKIGTILNQLRQLLDNNPLKNHGWTISIIRQNRFMVQIEMHHTEWNKSVEVDLLPSFDADVNDPVSRSVLYGLMASYDNDTQQFCSAALAELQRDFVKTKPAKLKNLIRLVKHWCKTYLHWEYGKPRLPNSYLIELLTIHVWEKAGSPLYFNTALLFKDVMEAFYSHAQLNVKWEVYYESHMIAIGTFSKIFKLEGLGLGPKVMDPANPYNNVYDVVEDWASVEAVARQTLRMPLLQQPFI